MAVSLPTGRIRLCFAPELRLHFPEFRCSLMFLTLALLRLRILRLQEAKKKSKKEASEGDVLQLTSATFDAAVKENDPLLVAFVAPWCGHWCVMD